MSLPSMTITFPLMVPAHHPGVFIPKIPASLTLLNMVSAANNRGRYDLV